MKKLTQEEKQRLISAIIYEERKNSKRVKPYTNVAMVEIIVKEIVRFTKERG